MFSLSMKTIGTIDMMSEMEKQPFIHIKKNVRSKRLYKEIKTSSQQMRTHDTDLTHT